MSRTKRVHRSGPGSKWIVVHPFLHDEESGPWGSATTTTMDDDVRWLEPSALDRIAAPRPRDRREKERMIKSEKGKRGKGRHKNQIPKERYPAGTRLLAAPLSLNRITHREDSPRRDFFVHPLLHRSSDPSFLLRLPFPFPPSLS